MRNRQREHLDFYRTPLECAKLVFPIVSENAWEPCAGDGAIVDVLDGKIKYASDINPRRSDIKKADFLESTSSLGYDMIVTNPPFFIAKEIILKALSLNMQAVVLIRLEWLNAMSRKDLQEKCDYIGIVSNLVKFTTQDGRIVNGNGTGRVAWCRFKPKNITKFKQIDWLYYRV